MTILLTPIILPNLLHKIIQVEWQIHFTKVLMVCVLYLSRNVICWQRKKYGFECATSVIGRECVIDLKSISAFFEYFFFGFWICAFCRISEELAERYLITVFCVWCHYSKTFRKNYCWLELLYVTSKSNKKYTEHAFKENVFVLQFFFITEQKKHGLCLSAAKWWALWIHVPMNWLDWITTNQHLTRILQLNIRP